VRRSPDPPKRRFENVFLELLFDQRRNTLQTDSSLGGEGESIHVGGASSPESWDSSASVGSASW
jgi:hypothetical protein